MKPYNSIRSFLILAVLSTALFAEDKPATTEPSIKAEAKEAVKEVVASQTTELAKTGNEALRFMLDKAKSYTGKVENAVGQAVDVAQKEAPETIRQFLVWRAWKHGLMAACVILPILAGFCVFLFGIRLAKRDSDWIPVPVISGLVTLVIGSIAMMDSGIPNILSLIQIWVAPRIYLIEQVTQLLK